VIVAHDEERRCSACAASFDTTARFDGRLDHMCPPAPSAADVDREIDGISSPFSHGTNVALTHGMNRSILLSYAGVALLAGCGSSAAVPADRVASTEAAIRAAREIGALQTPQAALHLRLAEEQLELSKRLIKENENKRAGWVLSRAESDAEVAVALAKEGAARAVAQQSLDRVRQARMQLNQGQSNVQQPDQNGGGQ